MEKNERTINYDTAKCVSHIFFFFLQAPIILKVQMHNNYQEQCSALICNITVMILISAIPGNITLLLCANHHRAIHHKQVHIIYL